MLQNSIGNYLGHNINWTRVLRKYVRPRAIGGYLGAFISVIKELPSVLRLQLV